MVLLGYYCCRTDSPCVSIEPDHCRTGFSREGEGSDDTTAANVPASSRLKPVLRRLCENVTSEGKTRQKQAEKRSLGVLNEHFAPVFNAVLPSAVVFTQSVRVEAISQMARSRTRPHHTTAISTAYTARGLFPEANCKRFGDKLR